MKRMNERIFQSISRSSRSSLVISSFLHRRMDLQQYSMQSQRFSIGVRSDFNRYGFILCSASYTSKLLQNKRMPDRHPLLLLTPNPCADIREHLRLDVSQFVNYPPPKGGELLVFASTELLVHTSNNLLIE